MPTWKFLSRPRLIAGAVIAAGLVFCVFTFIPLYADILATRTLAVKIFDYVLNFIIFFVVVYLAASLVTWLYRKLSRQSKSGMKT